MLKVEEIIISLSESGVQIYLDEGRLKTRTSKNGLSEEMIQLIRNNKERLIEYLASITLNLNDDHENYTITPFIDRSNPMALSFSQERLWFLNCLEGDNAAYNISKVVPICGDFNIEVAEKTLALIIRRHEPLRTVFKNSEDGPVQIIRKDVKFKLTHHNLTKLNDKECTTQINLLVASERRKIFDLSDDIMLRGTYLECTSSANGKFGVLILTMHHIASDGWSMNILLKEFSTLYQSMLAGKMVSLEPIKIQYADYAQWQRKWLQSDGLHSQYDYWEKQLADLPVVHSLPLDFERSKLKIHEGALLSEPISAETCHDLLLLARKFDVTPFMLIHAALGLVLTKHSGSNDIIIGVPIANRMQSALEPLIGFFVNTLVLRINTQHASLNAYISHVREVNLSAQANQEIPFEKLVERFQSHRSTQHSPLFQIMLSMNTNEGADLNINDGHKTESKFNSNKVAKYDLTIGAKLTEKGGYIAWEYDASIFKRHRIESFNTHLHRLLNAMLDFPNARLSDLTMMSKKEINSLLYHLNPKSAENLEYVCINDLFESQTLKAPDAIALVFEGQHLTYGELNRRSNQLAHYLISLGCGAEVCVAICVERSLDMVLGILGIIKSGAVYVPIDPNYPIERIKFIIEDSGVSILLTQDILQSEIPVGDLKTVVLDKLIWWTHFDSYPSTNVDKELYKLKSDNAVYLIYTSGSSGQAKGVVGLHKGLVNRVKWIQDFNPITKHDILCQKTQIGFVDHVAEIFQSLSTGVSLIILPDTINSTQSSFSHFLNAWHITQITLVPTLLRTLIENEEISDNSKLKTIYCSGEALIQDDLTKISERFPHTKLFNIYGSTEVSADVSAFELSCQSKRSDKPSVKTIGKPINNIQLYVVGTDDKLAPVGAAGELWVAGVGLSRGYYNRPALTADRFIPNPFSSISGDRLYRTGDIVRNLGDENKLPENLEYIARIDRQVKIRGCRIEPGEIENVLMRHKWVKAAVVQARAIQSESNSLVAYIVSKKEFEFRSDTRVDILRKHCQKYIAEYMIPSVYIFLEKMPLLFNGKINLRALRAPEAADFQKAVYVEPSSKIEKMLCQIWQDVLQVDKVGIHDNFFALGGHSLLIMKLVVLIRKNINVELPVQQIFDSPTIKQLSSVIEGKPMTEINSITRVPSQSNYNISYAQKVAWVNNQVSLANRWNSFFVQKIIPVGNADLSIIAKTLELIFQRHAVFRTTIHEVDGCLKQRIHAEVPIDIEKNTVNITQEEDHRVAIDRIKAKEFKKTIDVSKLPHFSIKLVTLEENCYVVLTIDHVCVDALSLMILEQEFYLIYSALIEKNNHVLATPVIDYKDYSSWEFEEIHGPNGASHRQYWHNLLKTNLESFNPLKHFSDYKVPSTYSYQESFNQQMENVTVKLHPLYPQMAFATVRKIFTSPLQVARYMFCVESAVFNALKQIAVDHCVMFSVLAIASVNLLLAKLTGKDKSIMSILSDLRIHDSLLSMIGCFVQDVLFVSEIEKDMTLAMLLKSVEHQLAMATKHKVYPMTQLMSEFDISLEGIQTIQLNLINNSNHGLKFFEPKHVNNGIADMGIHLNMNMYNDGLMIDCQYSCELFKAESIESIMKYYQLLLSTMIHDSDNLLLNFPVHPDYPKSGLHNNLHKLDEKLAEIP